MRRSERAPDLARRRPSGRAEGAAPCCPAPLGGHGAARVSDLYWFGPVRRARRGPAALVLASRTVSIETEPTSAQGARSTCCCGADPRQHRRTPASLSRPAGRADGARRDPRAASLVRDHLPPGSVAPAPPGADLQRAGGARPAVGGRLDGPRRRRARPPTCPAAAGPGPAPVRGRRSGPSGLLALAGIAGEGWSATPGWQLLDAGRGLESAQQVAEPAAGHARAACGPDVDGLSSSPRCSSTSRS